MKISAIFGLLKKSKAIITYKKDYKQWISDGAAAYDVSFLPELDAATVFAIAGIPEKAQDDFTIRENEVWNNIFDADDTDRSNEIDALPLMNFQCIFAEPRSDLLYAAELYISSTTNTSSRLQT